MILRYRSDRMAIIAVLAILGAIGCIWAGFYAPASKRGVLSIVENVAGPGGIAAFMLLAAGILLYGACRTMLKIASGFVIAESDEDGLSLHTANRPIRFNWNEIQSIERKKSGNQKKFETIVFHHDPRRLGPFNTIRSSTLIPSLLKNDKQDVDRWLAQVEARLTHS